MQERIEALANEALVAGGDAGRNRARQHGAAAPATRMMASGCAMSFVLALGLIVTVGGLISNWSWLAVCLAVGSVGIALLVLATPFEGLAALGSFRLARCRVLLAVMSPVVLRDDGDRTRYRIHGRLWSYSGMIVPDASTPEDIVTSIARVERWHAYGAAARVGVVTALIFGAWQTRDVTSGPLLFAIAVWLMSLFQCVRLPGWKRT